MRPTLTATAYAAANAPAAAAEQRVKRLRAGARERVDRRLEILGQVVHGCELVNGDVVLVN